MEPLYDEEAIERLRDRLPQESDRTTSASGATLGTEEYRRLLMLDLPATAVIDEEVRLLRISQGTQIGDPGKRVGMAELRLELARERDAIQAMRSAACWCLGLGGRGRTFVTVAHLDDDGVDHEPVWREFCGHCADGQAAEERRAEVLKMASTRQRERRLKLLWESAELDDYRGARLSRALDGAAYRDGLAKIRRWLDEGQRRALLIAGPVGSGKTWMSVATMLEWMERNEGSVWFTTVADMLQMIRDTYDEESEERTSAVLARAKRVGLLVLDGLGDTTPTLSEHDQGKVLEVFNARGSARMPTILTTNLSSKPTRQADGRTGPSAIEMYLGERALSRLVGMCGGSVAAGGFIVEWGGSDQRMKGWVA